LAEKGGWKMGMEELEARIKRLEDIEEIKKLKATCADK